MYIKYNTNTIRYTELISMLIERAIKIFGKELMNKTLSKNRSKKREEVYIRYSIFYILHNKYGMGFTDIGNIFGFNHATIINAINKSRDWIEMNDTIFIEGYYGKLLLSTKSLKDDLKLNNIDTYVLAKEWEQLNLNELLKIYTEKMKLKVKNHDKLIEDVEKLGYKVLDNPRTIFVPWDIDPYKIPESLLILRDAYHYMIQTQIE